MLNPPPSTKIIDLAAPCHVVSGGSSTMIAFQIELHEAASEGGTIWMQRLIDQEGCDPSIKDSAGATAMHFAALRGRMEALVLLKERGVDVNVEDNSGCTPLAWLIMARQLEFGVDYTTWPQEWKQIHGWLLKQGAKAKYLPVFSFSV